MKLISGAALEGWKWGHDLKPNEEWDHRVTHYSVDFSPDGRLWTAVLDEHGFYRVTNIVTVCVPRTLLRVTIVCSGRLLCDTL